MHQQTSKWKNALAAVANMTVGARCQDPMERLWRTRRSQARLFPSGNAMLVARLKRGA